MQWTPEAEEALDNVPFFMRPRARARVEQEAAQAGKNVVTLAEVRLARQRLLSGVAAEVKGYRLDLCSGRAGCPNPVRSATSLAERIEKVLQASDLLGFLKAQGIQKAQAHHEFRVALAECPNACSQVQIKDVGIIAAQRPVVGAAPCSGCNGCVEACREGAIRLDPAPRPLIDATVCVACGRCLSACPTGTLTAGARGYRVQLGGKLGRHPQLGRELPGLYAETVVADIVSACLAIFKSRGGGARRFGTLLTPQDFESLAERFAPLT